MILTINPPTMLKPLLRDLDLGDIVVEHAPLDCRLGKTLLSALFIEAQGWLNSAQTLLLCSDRINRLKAYLYKLADAADVKLQNRPHHVVFPNGTRLFLISYSDSELDFTDPPFTHIDHLILLDAHKVNAQYWSYLYELAQGSTIVVGEFNRKDHWTYLYAREEETKALHRYSAKAIIDAFPDQEGLHDILCEKYSADEASRYLGLEDIDLPVSQYNGVMMNSGMIGVPLASDMEPEDVARLALDFLDAIDDRGMPPEAPHES